MGTGQINGAAIGLATIADERLRGHLERLRVGDSVLLDAGGYVGRWQRAAGSIEPLDANVREACSTALAGQIVSLQLVATGGSGLVTFGSAGQLWDTPDGQYRA